MGQSSGPEVKKLEANKEDEKICKRGQCNLQLKMLLVTCCMRKQDIGSQKIMAALITGIDSIFVVKTEYGVEEG